jgi:hypothetical protein
MSPTRQSQHHDLEARARLLLLVPTLMALIATIVLVGGW